MSFAITILRRTLYFISVIAATYTDELVRGGEAGHDASTRRQADWKLISTRMGICT